MSIALTSPLLPHESDEAFSFVLELQALVTGLEPRRGTSSLRARLQHTLVKMACGLVELDGGVNLQRARTLCENELRAGREAAGLLALLKAAGVVNGPVAERARTITLSFLVLIVRRLADLSEEAGPPTAAGRSPPETGGRVPRAAERHGASAQVDDAEDGCSAPSDPATESPQQPP